MKRREKLNRPVTIFLGHLPHKRHRRLNGFIQILARRVLLDKTGIRSILLGEISHWGAIRSAGRLSQYWETREDLRRLLALVYERRGLR
jgi:hypothetical protein